MKSSGLFILAGFAATTMGLVWQTHMIFGLRNEVAELRKDLRTSLETVLDKPAGHLDSGQTGREKLELIKLRLQVRGLNESLVESRARERVGSLRAVVGSLLPAQNAGPWKLRPEWKGFEALATNQYSQAMKVLAAQTNEYGRFLSLDSAAKMSLAVGRTEEARQFASDMLLLDDKFSRGDPEKANGDVVYNGHLVLGRIAVDEGRIEEAKQHLQAAGKSKGSPVLNGFGPNLSLAKDLLEKGEPEVVLQHLESCRKFWSDHGKLDEWIKDIEAGRFPDFGANLIY